MITEAIRNYEVSIWTLQDEFITVLKWSNLEHKGEIENPKLTLDVDGTRNFTFNIPMYLYENGELVENPIWYNTRNGNIAVDMRKIKVIFNKNIIELDNVDWSDIYKKVYAPKGYYGNVDLYRRPVIRTSSLTAAGYSNVSSDEYETVCPQIYTYTRDNINYNVIYTPIDKDGNILGPSGSAAYFTTIRQTGGIKEQMLYDASHQKRILAITTSSASANSFCEEIRKLQSEWVSIRAANNWFGYTSYDNLGVTFSQPEYTYYKKYLSTCNTFEFLITKINETHEKDILTCEVTCEGLAFHELGKRGYIYELSQADFELEEKKWQESNGSNSDRPCENVQFWCEKIGLQPFPICEADIDPSQWYYEIQMNYDQYSNNETRLINRVYEEPFASDWTINENTGELFAQSFETMKEKERAIEVSESNVYNITQTIAEKFEIYCRYEYGHDTNYHITYRKIIFFNNYLHDYHTMSITYPYSSSKISREMDSTDIVTKLFVRPQEDYTTLLGDMNIRYSTANKTQEDYILNFDYLKETGNITDEQSDAIEAFEIEMHTLNKAIYPLQNKIAYYNNLQTDLEAKQTYYENAIKLDKEQLQYNEDYITQLTNGDGIANEYIDSHDNENPEYTIITHDRDGVYCINLANKKKGIRPDSVKIYRYYNSANHTFPQYIPNSNPAIVNEVTGFSFKDDEYGNPEYIYGIEPLETTSAVYMTYQYEPITYYTRVMKTWEEKTANDEIEKAKIDLQLDDPNDGVYAILAETQTILDTTLAQKQEAIRKFERLMGPALREGYWQPEEYQDYGQLYEKIVSLPNGLNTDFRTENTGTSLMIGWDDRLFEEEQDVFYYRSINSTKIAYPMIDLSGMSSDMLKNIDKYSFIFNNNYYTNITSDQLNEVRYTKSYSVGSEAILGFILDTYMDTIIPVLILVGAKNMTDEQLEFMYDSTKGHPRLGQIIIDTETSTEFNRKLKIDTTTVVNITTQWINPNIVVERYVTVFPRIKFSSLMLKTDTDSLYIRYNDTLLTQFEDYYIRNRHIATDTYAPEYLVTIKPAVLFKEASFNGTVRINYILSNASTSIYVDALEVSKENAYPKVSYTVDPNILDKNLLRTLHTKLNWLVMINDIQLKFKNVFGYISKLELDLDFPDKDSIEIKNYKTKFEDLFSTIVAQTEAMKQSQGLLSSLRGGTYNLQEESLASTLETNTEIVYEYLDNYIWNSEKVKEFLSGIFTEAGNILSDANQTLNQNQALTIENSQILSTFATQIQKELIPKVYRQQSQPKIFNKGDIWIEIDTNNNEVARYIATSDSSNSNGEYGGWIKTYNGSLAQIRGAGIDIDTVASTIDIHAQDVSINGDRSVNIMGVSINLISQYYPQVNNVSTGTDVENNIWLVSQLLTQVNNEDVWVDQSSVTISPKKISMISAEIEMGTGSVVNGQLQGTTAMRLSGTDGIWLGSSKKISMFADGNTGTVANVEISPAHIFFGMNNVSNGNNTALEITDARMILAAGNAFNTITTTSGGITINGSLLGLEITKDKFALAVNNNSTRAAIIAGANGITVGAGITPESSGSFVNISGGGVTIGSNGHLNVSTQNFIVSSNASGSDTMFFVGSGTTENDKYIRYLANGTLEVKGSISATTLQVGSGNNLLTYDSTNGLIVKGSIYTTNGTIGAWNINADHIDNGITFNNLQEINSTHTVNGITYHIGATGMGYNLADWAFWAGDGKFSVRQDGSVVITRLIVYNEEDQIYEVVDLSKLLGLLSGEYVSGPAAEDDTAEGKQIANVFWVRTTTTHHKRIRYTDDTYDDSVYGTYNHSFNGDTCTICGYNSNTDPDTPETPEKTIVTRAWIDNGDTHHMVTQWSDGSSTTSAEMAHNQNGAPGPGTGYNYYCTLCGHIFKY